MVTQGRAGHRLFLNGNLQFAERDEYRYHEALVHPAMAAHGAPRKVAVLGGGDGMAVREVLRYPGVESVTLVELDPNMTRLFSTHETLKRLNGGALTSPKLKIVNADAFGWLEETREVFDVIIVDFPDPTNFSIGKLYTSSFYALLDQRLAGERLRGDPDHLAAGGAAEFLDRGGDAGVGGPADTRRTTPMCPASASGASSSRDAGRCASPRRCRRTCASSTSRACRSCSSFRATWRACRPRSTACPTSSW